jgi:alpha-D-ribose 1-methylphosphonate 5-triphosphate synthase subunit PhnL
MSAILKIAKLSKHFILYHPPTTIDAIHDIDMELNEGEFTGLTGKSGSGKSTILKCIYRTYIPQQGSMMYHSANFGWIDICSASERQMCYLRKYEIGYVSQFLHAIPRISAIELVQNSMLEMGCSFLHAHQEAKKILKHFELDPTLWDNYPVTFSGGEKLRLNIARAMVKHPRLLLLDEPTASLDATSKIKVRELMQQLISEGTTMLGIFHDIEFMRNLCHKEYKIAEGRIYESI